MKSRKSRNESKNSKREKAWLLKNVTGPEHIKYRNTTKIEVMIIIDYTVKFIDVNTIFL